MIERYSLMLWSPDVQVSYVIVCDSNTSAFTVLIIINIKNKNIKITAFIDCEVKRTFIYKDLVK